MNCKYHVCYFSITMSWVLSGVLLMSIHRICCHGELRNIHTFWLKVMEMGCGQGKMWSWGVGRRGFGLIFNFP